MPLPVVAAVLADERGRVLLSQRPSGTDFAGCWEFPGGKCEAGESPIEALRRELSEELGLCLEAAEPLIRVPHRYPHKRIALDVFRVTVYAGTPVGREGQAWHWVAPDELADRPMPPADRPVLAALTQPDRYAITTPSYPGDASFLPSLDRLWRTGVRRLQLRWPGLPRAESRRIARVVLDSMPSDAELLLNDDIEGAALLGCGVHLRAAQLIELERRPLPAAQPVAASCHDAAELMRAEALGVDFAVLGPVQTTASHPDRPALAWAGFAEQRETSALPVYALGGLGLEDRELARRHGAQGIAAIRAFWPP